MEPDNFKRTPGIEKNISDITEKDYRVRLFGMVIETDTGNNFLLLDDGSGRIGIMFSDPENIEGISNGNLIRVIGKVRPGEELTIEAEIINDMSKIDIELYKQAKKRINELNV